MDVHKIISVQNHEYRVLQIRSRKVSSLKFKLRVKEYTFPFVQLTISSTKEKKAKKKLSFK